MKKLIHFILLILLLVGCQNQNKYEQVIARADSLMESNQDSARSALAMLDSLKSHEAIMSEHDSANDRMLAYYQLCKQMDAAILAYRKLLQKAEGLDDKEKAYRGLTKAYQILCQKDSMAKYAILMQETNDSLFRKQATATLVKMQLLYNYDQAERKAQHLAITNRYLKCMGGCGLFIFLLIFGITIVLMRQKNLKQKLEMKQKMEELHLLLIQCLKDNQDLKKQIKKIEAPAFVNMYLKVNQTLEESEIRHLLKKKAAKGQLATDEELEKVRLLVGEFCPRFYVLVFEKENLSDAQRTVCLLARLFFTSADLQTLLGISSGYASNVKRTLSKKLFGEEISPREFDARIYKMV